MTHGDRRTALAELRVSLEGLLSSIEGSPSVDAPALERAWERCEQAFGRVAEAQAGRAGWPEELRGAVEANLRLYAVAGGMLAERRAALADQRALLERARSHLAGRPGDSAGRSCDVSG